MILKRVVNEDYFRVMELAVIKLQYSIDHRIKDDIDSQK